MVENFVMVKTIPSYKKQKTNTAPLVDQQNHGHINWKFIFSETATQNILVFIAEIEVHDSIEILLIKIKPLSIDGAAYRKHYL